MSRVRAAGGWFGALLVYCVLLLPRAVRRLATGDVVSGLLLLPLGVLALLLVLLTTVNEVRVLLLYWWTDEVTPGTWGGPTMAGAWAVHALLGLVLFPVLVAVMAGIRTSADRVGSGSGRYVVVLADLLTLAFLVAFVRQL